VALSSFPPPMRAPTTLAPTANPNRQGAAHRRASGKSEMAKLNYSDRSTLVSTYTHSTIWPKTYFKTGALNHSATLPACEINCLAFRLRSNWHRIGTAVSLKSDWPLHSDIGTADRESRT
jgi:hypothetical protein